MVILEQKLDPPFQKFKLDDAIESEKWGMHKIHRWLLEYLRCTNSVTKCLSRQFIDTESEELNTVNSTFKSILFLFKKKQESFRVPIRLSELNSSNIVRLIHNSFSIKTVFYFSTRRSVNLQQTDKHFSRLCTHGLRNRKLNDQGHRNLGCFQETHRTETLILLTKIPMSPQFPIHIAQEKHTPRNVTSADDNLAQEIQGQCLDADQQSLKTNECTSNRK